MHYLQHGLESPVCVETWHGLNSELNFYLHLELSLKFGEKLKQLAEMIIIIRRFLIGNHKLAEQRVESGWVCIFSVQLDSEFTKQHETAHTKHVHSLHQIRRVLQMWLGYSTGQLTWLQTMLDDSSSNYSHSTFQASLGNNMGSSHWFEKCFMQKENWLWVLKLTWLIKISSWHTKHSESHCGSVGCSVLWPTLQMDGCTTILLFKAQRMTTHNDLTKIHSI